MRIRYTVVDYTEAQGEVDVPAEVEQAYRCAAEGEDRLRLLQMVAVEHARSNGDWDHNRSIGIRRVRDDEI